MSDVVKSVEAFTLTLPRDTPYLGAPRAGEEPNEKGYLVREGNRTVYPIFDRSIVVRIETVNSVIGWGETYGLVAPGAVGDTSDGEWTPTGRVRTKSRTAAPPSMRTTRRGARAALMAKMARS